MAVRQYGPRSVRWRLGGAGFGPFEGGLNLRDSFTEVAPNELADGTNFTLDERGVAIKRNDCPASADFPAPPGAVTAFFFSRALNLAILQSGATLYKCAIGGGSWTSFKVLGDSSVCAFCDFKSELVYVNNFDGIFTYDGTTNTLRLAVAGIAIATWQNKVWMGTNQTGFQNRVLWSNVGDAHTWTNATDFVDLREKDDKPLTALFGGSGLLAFKEDSAYRINDSTTGANQTIDWNTGCVGPLAVCGSDEGIFVWGKDGLYRGNGLGQFVLVGDKLRPRFTSTNINATTKPLIAGVYLNGRVYFAFPRTSSTIPDAIMEYNPRVGWMMEAYFNARVGPFASYLNSAGVPAVSFASAAATIKGLYTSTTRTGFAASLTTGYVEPFGGYLGRILTAHPQVTVPASSSLQFGINYEDSGDVIQNYTSTLTGPTAGGTFRPRLQPKMLGSAFAVTLNDTASPLTSMSVLGCELSALLMALR